MELIKEGIATSVMFELKKKSDNQVDCLFLRCSAKAGGRIVLPISDELQNNSPLKLCRCSQKIHF